MNCFNMDLEIRFNFEFGNAQRTLVECENESKDFINSIKDFTDVTLAADDDKEIKDSVENVDAGDVKTEPDELQTPCQI